LRNYVIKSRATSAGVEQAEIGSLARRAQAGDKQAQLELGIRFEEGRGVKRNLKKAEKLYRLAASDSLNEVAFYQPKIGSIPAQSLKLKAGSKNDGLHEARERLKCLEIKE